MKPNGPVILLLALLAGLIGGVYLSKSWLPSSKVESSLTDIQDKVATHSASKMTGNSFETANEITPGYDTQGTLTVGHNTDFYNFNLSSPARIKITLKNLPDDLGLYLYNQDRQIIASSTRSGVEESSFVIKAQNLGKFYIKVESNYKTQSNYPYTIRVGILPFFE